TVTLGLNILVQRAVILRDEGKTAEEIVALLEVEKQSICIVAAIDTLEYLLKGGRLSKTAAITGTLLNVKPMLLVEHGVINVTGKSRGMKKAQSRIFKTIRSLGGIDFTQPFAIGYSGDPQPFAAFEEQCKKRFGSHKPNICIIGSVLGTHIGPGAVAVAFFKVKKD
ncbi:MAG: DegV family EDD domain-containing protein, partial [Coriobacteriia bacterium]|nr:DegV family EDD domain-containing protein [Coriobacteriia bacterium]